MLKKIMLALLAMAVIHQPEALACTSLRIKPPEYDHAVWSVVADLKELKYYYHTYENKTWKYIDLKQALSRARQVMSLPLFTKPSYIDARPTARDYKNPDPKFYWYLDRR